MNKQFSDLVRPSQFHRPLVGVRLKQRREALGLKSGEFAKLCGWSSGQQSRLESGVYEVRVGITNKIIEVFERAKDG